MSSANSNPMVFKKYSYIKIVGDANAPARMWKVGLYTETEYNAMSEEEREGVVLMLESNRYLVEMHFGREDA